jgi:hypothetical protein
MCTMRACSGDAAASIPLFIGLSPLGFLHFLHLKVLMSKTQSSLHCT